MRSILTTVAAVLFAVSAFAADNFIVDKNHSEATFQVRHLVSRVSGRFNDFSGAISVDEANPAVSSVEFTIKAPSIDTGNDSRDKDPEITFKSTSVKPTSRKNVYDVTGTFTMHGVTKTITLPVEFLGFIKDPRGNIRAGFAAHVTLNRKDYGIIWNRALDAGGTLLGDDVVVNVNIEAAKSAAAIKEEIKKEKSK